MSAAHDVTTRAVEEAGRRFLWTDTDPAAPTVEATDTNLGVVATVTWPDLRGKGSTNPHATHGERFPDRLACVRVADLIREHCPTAEIWWDYGCQYLAVRQAAPCRDVVLYPGETFRIVAGEVSR